MSATEVLRRLLNERGVEWESGLPTETIVREPNDALYVERPDGRMHVYFRSYLTPEQAIAATLGWGNVGRYVGLRQGKYWERTENSDYYCGGCGWKVTDHDSYCPECGGALHEATLGHSSNCSNSERNCNRASHARAGDKGGRMSYCRFTEGDVYAYACDGGVQFYVADGKRELDRLCNTFNEAYQYARTLRDTYGLDVPSHAIEELKADAIEEAARICGPDSVVAELEAENARLRAMRDTWAENDAKLRELVRELYEDQCDECDQWKYRDRMAQLGIEVDG